MKHAKIPYYVLATYVGKHNTINYYAGTHAGVALLTTDFAEAVKWHTEEEAEAYIDSIPKANVTFKVEEHAWA